MTFRRLFLILLIALLFASPGCGGGGGQNGGKGLNLQSDQVTLSPSTQVLEKGNILQMQAVRKSPFGTVITTATFIWVSSDVSIATVDENGLVQALRVGVVTITAASGGAGSGSSTVGVVSPDKGSATLNLSGDAFYEDKLFDSNGFTGVIKPTPIRNAVVEAVAIDGFLPFSATGVTDENGNFTLPPLNNSTRRGGVYVRVLSKTAAASATKVVVNNKPANAVLFSSASLEALDDSQSASGILNVLATTSGIGGAFNILDALSLASEFVQGQSGCPGAGDPCIPSLVTAYWEPGSSEGTFYDGKSAISILGGGGGDADEYDDSVIIHEYGHFILSQFSHDDSLGGQHGLTEHDQDIRLSWSEGWANFFSSAVRGQPFYVDTFLNQNPLSFNMENYSSAQTASLKANAIYTTSEVAVAGTLWDVFDSTSESSDNLSLGFTLVWKTVLGMSPKPIKSTMEEFWLTFKDTGATSIFSGLFQSILSEREIELKVDNTEGAEQQLTLAGGQQHHTLYTSNTDPSGDVDVIPLSVSPGTSYTLKTLNLSNGTDTYLEIRTTGGGTLLFGPNDNPGAPISSGCLNSKAACPRNGPGILAATLSFNSGSNSSLEAHVKRSPSAPPSSGRFGAYDILLTTP